MPQFADPQVLQLLWATPLFATMGVVAALLRRRAARRFQPDARWHAGARPNGPPQRSLRPLKVGLLTLAFVALVALVGLQLTNEWLEGGPVDALPTEAPDEHERTQQELVREVGEPERSSRNHEGAWHAGRPSLR